MKYDFSTAQQLLNKRTTSNAGGGGHGSLEHGKVNAELVGNLGELVVGVVDLGSLITAEGLVEEDVE